MEAVHDLQKMVGNDGEAWEGLASMMRQAKRLHPPTTGNRIGNESRHFGIFERLETSVNVQNFYMSPS
jgi:hypothetical protein